MPALKKEIADLIRTYQARAGKLLTIGSVESATGGKIADEITDVPGSSDYFKGSIIAYSNEIKTGIVGVKKETINTHGAVSAKTAMEMAEGGRRLLQVDICIADTGIAGPTGTTPGKPVGLFYLGLAAKHTSTSRKRTFKGTRLQNKQQATQAALLMIKDYLSSFIAEPGKANNCQLERKHVVTCFLENNNRILILKRSEKVGSYRGQWAGVSGYMESNDIEQACTEIKEETGLNKADIEIRAKGSPLEITDNKMGRKWIVHPFLFHVKSPGKIKIDWEHIESQWIEPEDIDKFDTVPGLGKALNRVLKTPKSQAISRE